MRRTRESIGVLSLVVFASPAVGQQIGKYVPIQAGSEADHALTEISKTSDPAQKLALIDKFAESRTGRYRDRGRIVRGLLHRPEKL